MDAILTSDSTELLLTHTNAPLTPNQRRRLASSRVDDGWADRRAAERFLASPSTASRWARRYRAGLPLSDPSSRPGPMPSRLPQRLERRIVALRSTRRWGPDRLPRWCSTCDGRRCPDSVPDAATASSGPDYGPTDPQVEARTLWEASPSELVRVGITSDGGGCRSAAADRSKTAVPALP